MKYLTRTALAVMLCGGFAVTAQADGHMCSDYTFVPGVYERWPFADDGCMEVVTRPETGKKYARFEATVVSQSPSGTFVRYSLREGGMTPSRKVDPPPGFEAMIGGKAMAIDELQPRQKVNVYLPIETATVQPVVAAAAPPPPPPPPPPPAPEPEPEPMMPTTAGNFGWLALFGGLFLLMGGALRHARQRR
jgi:hypothetical protein